MMLRRFWRHAAPSAGPHAAIIGEVVAEHPGMVLMKTEIGGTRVLDVLFGEQLRASADRFQGKTSDTVSVSN